ncbi:hypothetical protein, partial [Pseudoalteromonas fuliginea]
MNTFFKSEMYIFLQSMALDLLPRALPLITTILIVSSESNDRVVDYLFTLAVFNVAAVLLNFGAQYQISTSSKLLNQKIFLQCFVISASIIFVILSAYEQSKEVVAAIVLGAIYAHLNEFRLRREGKILKFFVATLLLITPRVVSWFTGYDYYFASLCSALLLLILVVTIKEPNESNKNSKVNIFNFAFYTSLVIVIYQQVPSLFSVSQGVDDNERLEQIVIRVLFGLMFIKTTLVVLMIHHEIKIKFSKYAFVVLMIFILVFVSYLNVNLYIKYFIYIFVFF